MDLEKNNSLIYFYHTRKQNSSKCGPHSKDEIENLIKNNVIKKESWICVNNEEWKEAQKTDFAKFFNENNSNFQPQEIKGYYYIDKTGNKTGPVNKDIIENLFKTGLVKNDTKIWDGINDWVDISKIFPDIKIQTGNEQKNKNSNDFEVIDVFFILIPLLSALISVIILHSISPLAVLMSHYTLLSATIFFMAVLTSVDSDKIKEISSTGYFFGVLFLYPIIYPIYLYKRNEYGKKNLSVLGVFTIIILIVASMYVVGSIGKMQNEAIERLQDLGNYRFNRY